MFGAVRRLAAAVFLVFAFGGDSELWGVTTPGFVGDHAHFLTHDLGAGIYGSLQGQQNFLWLG
jgi:hypothetical protein